MGDTPVDLFAVRLRIGLVVLLTSLGTTISTTAGGIWWASSTWYEAQQEAVKRHEELALRIEREVAAIRLLIAEQVATREELDETVNRQESLEERVRAMEVTWTSRP